MPAARIAAAPSFEVVLRREDEVGPIVVIVPGLERGAGGRFGRCLFLWHAFIFSGLENADRQRSAPGVKVKGLVVALDRIALRFPGLQSAFEDFHP